MLAVESSHKLSQTAISVCIVISASQCKPKNKNLLFFPLHQVKVWMMSSHLLSTPLLCQAQIQTVTCTIISHFFSIAGEAPAVGKLGFILFIVPIHTRWRDSASISSTLSNFLFKNQKKQTRIFSFARRADATPLLCYDRCQKRLIFIHHVVKIADPWNKKSSISVCERMAVNKVPNNTPRTPAALL